MSSENIFNFLAQFILEHIYKKHYYICNRFICLKRFKRRGGDFDVYFGV